MAKHASARARGNKTSTAATLVPVDKAAITLPDMPAKRQRVKDDDGKWLVVEVPWQDQAKIAWAEIWSSPMVTEYLEADLPLIHAYVASVDDYWTRFERGGSITEAGKLMLSFAERFGIGPDSRRRLQWTVEAAESAMERGRKRQAEVEKPKPIDAQAAWDAIDDTEDIPDVEVVE